MTVARKPVTAGLASLLSASGFQTGVAQAPPGIMRDDDTTQLRKPYAILYPLPAVTIYGDQDDPESMARLPYQLTCVGRKDDNAQDLADLLRARICGRQPSGEFTHVIVTGTGVTVVERACSEIGTVTRNDDGLFQVVDVYDLEVHAT